MTPVPSSLEVVPAGWFLAALSGELRAGEPLGDDGTGEPVVLFRDRDGSARALPAACPHVGVDLGRGRVTAGRLRCPLHAWEFDGTGACVAAPGLPDAASRPAAVPLPCREALGAVFVRVGGGEAAFPSFSRNDPDRLLLLAGPRATVRAPWLAVVANAFDVVHLPVVHRRALVEPPSFEALGADAFRLRYVSRPTGSTLADRLTGALSGGRVESTITAWGAGVVVVETRAGRAETVLVIGIRPRGERTEVLPVTGVRRTGIEPLDAVSARLARWLYTRFLSPDLPILDGIRFEPRLAPGENPPLAAFLAWAARLPRRA